MQEAGPESPRAGARHERPLLIGRPRLSRAGRPGIGVARGQSWSNWTPGGRLQSRSLRGWRRRRAQSPGWEPGRDARTMPYLLISTQIRMVSTRRRRLGQSWGRARAEGAATAPWRLPLRQRLPVTGPGSRPGHAPSGGGAEAAEPSQPGAPDSGSPGRPGASRAAKGAGCVHPRGGGNSGGLRLLTYLSARGSQEPLVSWRSNHGPTQSRSAGFGGGGGGSANTWEKEV